MKPIEVVQLVFLKDNKVLLEKRWKHEDNYAGIWAPPGGHVDKNEKHEETVKREAWEELGIKIKEAEFVASLVDLDRTSHKLYLLHYFLCKKWDGEIRGTTEQEALEWHSLEKIDELDLVDVDKKAISMVLQKMKRDK